MTTSQGFEFNLDVMNTLFLTGLLVLWMVTYAVRLHLKGKPHFQRIEHDGGSHLLGKGMMEMAYWGLQPVGKFLVGVHITPNMISWASLALGILAGACLAFGHFGFAAAFATVSALCDSLDGMVARLTARSSDAGEVLDAAIDRYNEFFYLSGLLFYYHEIPMLMLLVLGGMIGSFMVSYSTAKAEALHVKPPRGSMRRTERAFYLTLGAALSPISIPWLEGGTVFPIKVGFPMVIALTIVATVSNFSAVERLWAISRAVRDPNTRQP